MNEPRRDDHLVQVYGWAGAFAAVGICMAAALCVVGSLWVLAGRT